MTATAQCDWTAESDASWVTITSGANGSGNGTIQYSVAENTSAAPRSAHITAGGQTHTINQVSTAPNVVTVVAPNGGEKAYTGSALFIDWTIVENTPIDHFDVLVSANGGAFVAVTGCSGLAASVRRCVWNAPAPVASDVLARVQATDIHGNPVADTSNATFRIINGAASMTLASPSSGAVLAVGSQRLIKWNHNLGSASSSRLEISRDGGSTWNVINAAVPNGASSTSFDWTVTGPTSSSVLFRVFWNGGAAMTSGPLVIIADPFLSVTAPNTSVNWGIGTSQKITWKHNLGKGSTVRLDISRDNGATWNVLVPSVTHSGESSGTYTWTVTGPASMNARLRVVWLAVPTVTDQSNVSFTIAAPFVEVTNPNSATHAWTVGAKHTIKWQSNLGKLESVKIELSADGGATYPIVLHASTPSDGSQSVTVQPGWVTAAARVRITWTDNGAVTDVSNSSFPIQ
jgi:hypothetical protein